MQQSTTIFKPVSEHGLTLNFATHLTSAGKINLGSFYTPEKYVRLVAEWLRVHDVPKDAVIAIHAKSQADFVAVLHISLGEFMEEAS